MTTIRKASQPQQDSSFQTATSSSRKSKATTTPLQRFVQALAGLSAFTGAAARSVPGHAGASSGLLVPQGRSLLDQIYSDAPAAANARFHVQAGAFGSPGTEVSTPRVSLFLLPPSLDLQQFEDLQEAQQASADAPAPAPSPAPAPASALDAAFYARSCGYDRSSNSTSCEEDTVFAASYSGILSPANTLRDASNQARAASGDAKLQEYVDFLLGAYTNTLDTADAESAQLSDRKELATAVSDSFLNEGGCAVLKQLTNSTRTPDLVADFKRKLDAC